MALPGKMALPVSRRGRLVSRLAAGATRYLRSRGDDNDDQRPNSANATGTPAHPLLKSSLKLGRQQRESSSSAKRYFEVAITSAGLLRFCSSTDGGRTAGEKRAV